MTREEFDFEELVDLTQSLIRSGRDFEAVVQVLRDKGVRKVHVAAVLAKASGLSGRDAAAVVHDSRAFAFRRATDEAVQNAVLDLLEDDEFVASLSSPTGDDELDE